MTQLVCFEKTDLKIDAKLEIASFLVLEMKITGNVRHLKIPRVKKRPFRKDKLWEHTCFEAFIRPKGENFYWEINYSPSGNWNVYFFKNYRKEMVKEKSVHSVQFAHHVQDVQLEIQTTFDFSNVPNFPKKLCEADFNLAAILEDKNGTKTHWALKHLSKKPDFHLF